MSLPRICALLGLLAVASPAAAAGLQDVLDTPAATSALAARGALNGLATAGRRIVAVGQRGHIVYSDDGGSGWRQAKVPVSADLVAVCFPSPHQGWAVGHDGVVLHSGDAGATWERQLDGRRLGDLLLEHYAGRSGPGALGTPEQAAALVDEAKRLAAQGPENPFLDVWFADEQTGFVVGAFNLILRTGDGGRSWTPWLDRTDNPNRLHLYAVRGIGGEVYAAGEQGLLLKLDAEAGRFRALATPYQGSFFGLAGNDGAVVAFGLRGNAFRSQDGGRSWQKVDTGLQEGLTGAAALGERGLVLVSQSGQVLVSRDGGAHFAHQRVAGAQPAAAVVAATAAVADTVVIAGARGVRSQALR